MINYYEVRDDLRKQIKGALHAEGVRHQTLADELGLSRVQITRILNGDSATSFETWERLAKRAGMMFTLTDLEGLPKEGKK